jgi:hypothetical protein
MARTILFLCLISIAMPLAARLEPANPYSTKGNFANPISPGTVFGLGQNIVNKHQFYTYINTIGQKNSPPGDIIAFYPSFIYGITDACSLYVVIPTIPHIKIDDTTDRGLANVSAQVEYAYYQTETEHALTQATVIGGMGFPTSTFNNIQNFSLKRTIGVSNSVTFFVGGTASYLTAESYIYASLGDSFHAITNQTITTTTHAEMISTCSTEKAHIKNGNTVFYQCGIGHNLGNPWGTTLLGTLEMNGIYSKKSTLKGVPQENSGGNLILLGPGLSLSSGRWLFQGGIQLPVLQKLNGTQIKTRYQGAFFITVVF